MTYHTERHGLGIAYSVIGFAVWAICDVFIKLLAEDHMSPYQIITLASMVGLIFMIVKTRVAQLDLRSTYAVLKPTNVPGKIICALFSFGAFLFNVIALKYLPLNMFYILVFTAPFMVALLAKVFLSEHLGYKKFLAILIGFIGVLIAINPTAEAILAHWVGYGAAFSSAVCFAANVVISRKIMQGGNADSVAFLTAMVQGTCGLVGLLFSGDMMPLTTTMLILIILTGVTGSLGNLLQYLSVKYIHAATSTLYQYTQILSGALLAYFVWHEIPTWHMGAGAVLIIVSGIYIARHGATLIVKS